MEALRNYILPLAVVLAIIILAIVLAKKAKATRGSHFDEMQTKIRSDGYKLGYLVTLICLGIWLLFAEVFKGFNQMVTPSFGAFFVMMFGIVVFAVYCIFHDSFFSIGENGRAYTLLCVFIVIANGVSAIRHIVDGTIVAEGKLTFSNTSSIIVAASFLVIVIAIVIKTVKDRKEAEG